MYFAPHVTLGQHSYQGRDQTGRKEERGAGEPFGKSVMFKGMACYGQPRRFGRPTDLRHRQGRDMPGCYVFRFAKI